MEGLQVGGFYFYERSSTLGRKLSFEDFQFIFDDVFLELVTE